MPTFIDRAMNRRPRSFSCLTLSLLIFSSALLTGCERSIRPDAAKVASAGVEAGKLTADYYDSLGRDVIRTWELNAFRDASGAAPTVALFDKDIERVEELLKNQGLSPTERQQLETELAQHKAGRLRALFPPVPPERRAGDIEILEPAKAELEKAKVELKSLLDKTPGHSGAAQQVIALKKEAAESTVRTDPVKLADVLKRLSKAQSALAQIESKITGLAPARGKVTVLAAQVERLSELVETKNLPDYLALLYKQRLVALRARRGLAQQLVATYDAFGQLADYDAGTEVRIKADSLVQSIGTALQNPLPSLKSDSQSIVGSLLGDAIQQIAIVQQNRSLRRAGVPISKALLDFRQVFANESEVYKGIAEDKSSQSTQIAKSLVESNDVISTALISDVLSVYELRWPEPHKPFTNGAIKGGIRGIIDARSKPLEQMSKDTADALLESYDQLAQLHFQLQERQPLTIRAFAESSSTARLLLEDLAKLGIPKDTLLGILERLQKGMGQ